MGAVPHVKHELGGWGNVQRAGGRVAEGVAGAASAGPERAADGITATRWRRCVAAAAGREQLSTPLEVRVPLDNERIAVIGCGVMGEAMVKGLLHERLVRPDQIIVSHPREDRRSTLEDRYGVRAARSNRDAAEGATMVVIAVKPQLFDEVSAELRGGVADEAMVVTIVAGIRMDHVAEALGTSRVVRVMPNTPGQIGRGISVWTATDTVDEDGRRRVRALLSALGVEELVRHENELDMATALSGTGPAYVFLFMEALIDAGVHLGFSRRLASKLVLRDRARLGGVRRRQHHPSSGATKSGDLARRYQRRGPVPAREGEDPDRAVGRGVGGLSALRGTRRHRNCEARRRKTGG